VTDRGLELRQLGALAQELCEAGRHDDEVLVNDCLAAGTWDIPAPRHVLERLRVLWEASKASKREWTKGQAAQRAASSEDRTLRYAGPAVH
jgi:hypothetical protein